MVRRSVLSTMALSASLIMACSSAPGPAKATAPEVKIGAPPAGTSTAAAESEPSVDPDADPELVTPPLWKRRARDTDTPACKKLAALQEAASKKDTPVPEGAQADSVSPTPCMPVAGGAWGLVGTVADYERMPAISTCTAYCGNEDCGPCHLNPVIDYVPVFVTDAGVVTRAAPLSDTFYSAGPSEEQIGTFDLDGDGSEELLAGIGKGAILSFKDGKISPYSKYTGAPFRAIVDVDQDSRPDLFLQHPYLAGDGIYSCGIRGGMGVVNFAIDLELFARSLPDGTFSTDDAAAQALTKHQCPGIPRHIVVKDADGAYDNVKIRQRVACARLWGVSADNVTKALEKECSWTADDEECDALFDVRDGAPVKKCASKEILMSWAKAAPPVTLK